MKHFHLGWVVVLQVEIIQAAALDVPFTVFLRLSVQIQ